MKRSQLLSVCVSLSITLLLVNPVYAVSLGGVSSAATTAMPSASTEGGLSGLLMKQLGVTQPQAEGGAGAVFQLAKSKMQGAAFEKLSASVPGMQGLLAAAPVANSGGGLGGMAGDLTSLAGNSGGTASNLVGLASSFQQLGLSPSMVQKFVPVVVQYVQSTGGGGVAGALQSALGGL